MSILALEKSWVTLGRHFRITRSLFPNTLRITLKKKKLLIYV